MATQLDRLLAIPEISDSTDFPDATTTPGLRTLDDALRCDICRDFYDAPCIRSALPINTTCPTCRKDASEVHLRKNAAVESAVQAWRVARPLILRLANEEHARKTRPELPKSAKAHPNEPPRKRKRSGSPVSVSDDEPIVVSSSPAPSGSATPDSLPDTVDCPMCQKAVLSQKINMHIDSDCKRHLAKTVARTAPLDVKGKQKQQWSKLLGGAGSSSTSTKGKEKGKGKARVKDNEDDAEPEHLPKVAYDIHPQKRIVELLNEWGLPTHGEKSALIKRHSRWIVLYNANVDRAPENRHTVEQLRIELRRAEEAEQKMRKEVVDDPVAYQKANRSTFAKLTEAARPKKAARSSEEASATAPTPSAPPSTTGMDLAEEAAPHEVVEID
ncbi:Postreplication repair E3 ubiquitin-protein ligase rad18 [Trametes pubescens]|uniref:Postreplication repair E3 ubiquitin-protein ligase rad18 n=1 Tax=Trametes pubescens TaxID=154538 RepID=A0A1M2VI67_TRAPU|nr:Postreplication repair E3 ubiquitin-protein ligase rad18 [Trametes pubescens]